MSKYTNGPWAESIDNLNEIIGPNDEVICKIEPIDQVGWTNLAREITWANSALISAAPEMLEALQEIIAACDKCAWSDNLSIVDEFTEEIENKARAAITKALGEN